MFLWAEFVEQNISSQAATFLMVDVSVEKTRVLPQNILSNHLITNWVLSGFVLDFFTGIVNKFTLQNLF